MNLEDCLQKKRDFHQLKLRIFASNSNYIDLSIVNPDLEPEKQIIDKLLEFSLQKKVHRYSSAQGLPELRQAIASRYQKKYGVNLDWQKQVTIARGTNTAIANILNLFQRKFQRAPRLLIPVPTYSMHLEVAKKCAANCFFYSLDQSEEHLLNSLKKIIELEKIDIILLNFPNNPTGKVVSKRFYLNLSETFRSLGTWVINDFVYGDLVFQQAAAPSLLENSLGNHFFEIYSLSKSFSLAGWRLSLILGDPFLVPELIQQQTEVDYGSYQGFQRAAAFALTSDIDYSEISKRIYQERAEFLISRLQTLGIEIKSEFSACFLWCQLPKDISLSSYEFCHRLISDYKVAVQPGEIFGQNLETLFRISLTADESQLTEAFLRIEALINSILDNK